MNKQGTYSLEIIFNVVMLLHVCTFAFQHKLDMWPLLILLVVDLEAKLLEGGGAAGAEEKRQWLSENTSNFTVVIQKCINFVTFQCVMYNDVKLISYQDQNQLCWTYDMIFQTYKTYSVSSN
jgi:hypothetical protein